MTLFKVTAGDPWPEGPPLFDEEDGTVAWKVAAFHISYEVSVGWVILQVRVAATRGPTGGRHGPEPYPSRSALLRGLLRLPSASTRALSRG